MISDDADPSSNRGRVRSHSFSGGSDRATHDTDTLGPVLPVVSLRWLAQAGLDEFLRSDEFARLEKSYIGLAVSSVEGKRSQD